MKFKMQKFFKTKDKNKISLDFGKQKIRIFEGLQTGIYNRFLNKRNIFSI